ncbi:MAG: GatB/YqeY domain-containing protein [Candidatus Spechtbacterales bacterium]
MNLKQQIQKDMLAAVKSRDDITRSTLRMLLAAIGTKEIELGKKDEGLDDMQAGEIVLKEIKKRQDAAQQYDDGGRPELASQERAEIEILIVYAPEKLPEQELRAIISAAIEKTGATGSQDTGSVMKEVMPTVQGRADGGAVQKLVQEYLSGS